MKRLLTLALMVALLAIGNTAAAGLFGVSMGDPIKPQRGWDAYGYGTEEREYKGSLPFSSIHIEGTRKGGACGIFANHGLPFNNIRDRLEGKHGRPYRVRVFDSEKKAEWRFAMNPDKVAGLILSYKTLEYRFENYHECEAAAKNAVEAALMAKREKAAAWEAKWAEWEGAKARAKAKREAAEKAKREAALKAEREKAAAEQAKARAKARAKAKREAAEKAKREAALKAEREKAAAEQAKARAKAKRAAAEKAKAAAEKAKREKEAERLRRAACPFRVCMGDRIDAYIPSNERWGQETRIYRGSLPFEKYTLEGTRKGGVCSFYANGWFHSKERALSEYDKVLTLLTDKYGKPDEEKPESGLFSRQSSSEYPEARWFLNSNPSKLTQFVLWATKVRTDTLPNNHILALHYWFENHDECKKAKKPEGADL